MLRFYFTLWCFLIAGSAAATQSVQLTLPSSSHAGSVQNQYIESLLRESFASQGLTVEIGYSQQEMNSARIRQSLQSGQHINLAWLGARHQQDPNLIAIPIALYNNVHGHRILLIQQQRQDEFSQITSLEQLANFVGLQHHSWSDYEMMVNNGLTVEGELSYPAMYKALDEGLADYFPRSAMTIVAEHRRHAAEHVVIEQSLVLRYPNEFYFYTHKADTELAKQLETGLRHLQQSGRFQQLFEQFYGDRLKALALEQRRVLELHR
ncbi:transporter substrate-binding domain-containing protein [Alkalimonas delamerensis]|uniref:Transporter substrate-binding domain-containing protein n=1 Tax=Alkalimonas delamerensis TaxID=265981 RepID=A0ABT9GND1_9GAMM|nr:transporter substrate-binding domain-containing protein [Alkalimonas delamerensis]MDP4528429.1 transporter substrate-binding domain-containing protein [Alkalimonas delamerensis]